MASTAGRLPLILTHSVRPASSCPKDITRFLILESRRDTCNLHALCFGCNRSFLAERYADVDLRLNVGIGLFLSDCLHFGEYLFLMRLANGIRLLGKGPRLRSQPCGFVGVGPHLSLRLSFEIAALPTQVINLLLFLRRQQSQRSRPHVAFTYAKLVAFLLVSPKIGNEIGLAPTATLYRGLLAQ